MEVTVAPSKSSNKVNNIWYPNQKHHKEQKLKLCPPEEDTHPKILSQVSENGSQLHIKGS